MERTKFKEPMTQQEAIDLMWTSKDVKEWNENRQTVKDSVDPNEVNKILSEIDGTRLIKRVLKGTRS